MHVTSYENYSVVRLSGEIDLSNSADLKDSLLAAIQDSSSYLVIDFTDVSYMDSSGLRVLFDVARRLKVTRRRVGMVLPPESPLQRLFSITHMEEVSPVCDSIQACVEKLAVESGSW